jgi:hypothetical protein
MVFRVRRPSKIGLLHAAQHKFELLHFGYLAQWGAFRGPVIYKHLFPNEDTSLLRLLMLMPRLRVVDSSSVLMLIKGYINQLCGETPTDLRMGAVACTPNYASLIVTLTETQRKAAINSTYQIGREARELEEKLQAQPQRFAMLGIHDDSYNAVVWVTSQVSCPLNSWWLN